MADIRIRSVRAAATTSGTPGVTTQDFTVSGFGTPTACLIQVAGSLTAITRRAHSKIGVGAADGTNERGGGVAAEDNVTNSNTGKTRGTSVIYFPNDDGSAVDAVASFD